MFERQFRRRLCLFQKYSTINNIRAEANVPQTGTRHQTGHSNIFDLLFKGKVSTALLTLLRTSITAVECSQRSGRFPLKLQKIGAC